MGDTNLVDLMILDGLWDAFNGDHMGNTAENVASKFAVTPEEQDQFALASQQEAEAAIKNGSFKDEIVPVPIPQRKGDLLLFETDEHPRFGTSYRCFRSAHPDHPLYGIKNQGAKRRLATLGIGGDEGAAIVVKRP